MYGNKINFYAYYMFLILVYNLKEISIFIHWVKPFYIMKRHNVDFCENKPSFMPHLYLPFQSYSNYDDKN